MVDIETSTYQFPASTGIYKKKKEDGNITRKNSL
jgi:hypothetical protein